MSRNFAAALRRMYGGSAPSQIIDRQPAPTIANLRDSAIIEMLWHANGSVDAVIAARVKDYYQVDSEQWLRLRDDGAERNTLVPAQLQMVLDEYLTESGIANQPETPLFRSTLSGTGKISTRAVLRRHVVNLSRNITRLGVASSS